MRLQLHALAYDLVNFMRTLPLPEEVGHWSLTTFREKLVKIGAKVVRQGRKTRPLCHFPIGRGCGAERLVPANPGPDR
ncbi:MAG: hypothetical protein GY869_32365 [Planctomycetes bacterium]|nr:hypothetical protein [Planctomycetota bacterium]